MLGIGFFGATSETGESPPTILEFEASPGSLTLSGQFLDADITLGYIDVTGTPGALTLAVFTSPGVASASFRITAPPPPPIGVSKTASPYPRQVMLGDQLRTVRSQGEEVYLVRRFWELKNGQQPTKTLPTPKPVKVTLTKRKMGANAQIVTVKQKKASSGL